MSDDRIVYALVLEIKKLEKTINERDKLLVDIFNDLLRRAMEDDELKIINLSVSIWDQLRNVIKEIQ